MVNGACFIRNSENNNQQHPGLTRLKSQCFRAL
jgi:hypothetical protein